MNESAKVVLGSIYERLLEYDVAMEAGTLAIRLNPFARKGSGSYYTPDELVRLIIERTVGPLVKERHETFAKSAEALKTGKRLAQLAKLDPATALLDLKVCDPAMGSGHFLVDLVDYLADRVIEATVAAAEAVDWTDYRSPLVARIEAIRTQIMNQAKANGWNVKEDQLDDRLIVRRMILKRVIYGVDKNPMAVELAKVALWLHTFTVGAPLSFLDHHLRCGDSLFGETVRHVMDKLAKRGALMLHPAIQRARAATKGMEAVELNTDADIAGVRNSAITFEGVREATAPLRSFMSLLHAFEWLDPTEKQDRAAIDEWLDGGFGEPVEIAMGRIAPRGLAAEQTSLLPDDKSKQQSLMKGATAKEEVAARFSKLLAEAQMLVAEERFHHWQIAYPGVWSDWESNEPSGGFDAVIGNPPWDQYEFDHTTWFESREENVALARVKKKQNQLIQNLRSTRPELWTQYEQAKTRISAGARVVKKGARYPLFGRGRFNLFGLFVERAVGLINVRGRVGMLVPTGIAVDARSSRFLDHIFGSGRLSEILDFENKLAGGDGRWFPAIHASARFCMCIILGRSESTESCRAAMFLPSTDEKAIRRKVYNLSYEQAKLLNFGVPTLPVFREDSDLKLFTKYFLSNRRLELFNPTEFLSNFDYDQPINKSTFEGTLIENSDLSKEGFYRVSSMLWKRGPTSLVPLIEGKMVQTFNHRAARIVINPTNLRRPASSIDSLVQELSDPSYFPAPHLWTRRDQIRWLSKCDWTVAFKDVTAVTNARTMIAAIVPKIGIEHNLPVLWHKGDREGTVVDSPLLLGNLNSLPYDFFSRTKIHHNHFTETFLYQVPLVTKQMYKTRFGPKTAAQIVKAEVLALTYTAHDMEPFARDMGHDGPPFVWDEMDRLKRRAKLDALYFLLYGITDRDDVNYIYSTFPIVEREEMALHGRYLSRDYCLMYMNALEQGDPDAAIAI